MEILEHKKNNLLHREEVIVSLKHSSSPSKKEAAKLLSEHFKKHEENVIINKIASGFGSKEFKINAKIYNTAEDKKNYETITRKQRRKSAEEQAKVAAEAKKAKVKEEQKWKDTIQSNLKQMKMEEWV